MRSHDATIGHSEHGSHPVAQHHHGPASMDTSYRLVVRTVLWVIAGLVFLAFVLWWSLT